MLQPSTERNSLPPRLVSWLAEQGFEACAVEPLEGDVSPRRYYRVRLESSASSVMAAYYPPELRDSMRTGTVACELLRAAGIRVAEILAQDTRLGFAVLEDLGEESLFSVALGSHRALALYRQAIESITAIGELDLERCSKLNPALETGLLRKELAMTWRLFLGQEIQRRTLRRELEAGLERLCWRLGEDPLVPCHRDYMARNLMVLPGDRLAVLDHQDLRLGPRHYDLGSLLNDSLRLTKDQAASLANEAGVADLAGYHRAAAQRCLKIVGTFHAFAERGSPRYLPMVPATLRRACAHLARLPETAALAPDLFAALALDR